MIKKRLKQVNIDQKWLKLIKNQVFLFYQHLIVDYSLKLLILMLIINGDINTSFPEANHKLDHNRASNRLCLNQWGNLKFLPIFCLYLSFHLAQKIEIRFFGNLEISE